MKSAQQKEPTLNRSLMAGTMKSNNGASKFWKNVKHARN
jgi:hypothetical protein